MGVFVFVMPLRTWLSGDFRTTWGPDSARTSAPRRRRSLEDALRLQKEFTLRLEPLIGSLPEWDESGPARSATAFSVRSFTLPFLQARRWSYRLKLPQMSVLETPQIWIPPAFDSVLHLKSLWSQDDEVMVGSLPRVKSELDLLLDALIQEEAGDWPELREVTGVGGALRELAEAGMEFGAPVIVEG